MTAAQDLRARQQARAPRVLERVQATRKPPPPTRADIEQIVASAAKFSEPQLYVQIRVPRSSKPKPGAQIKLFGRVGPLSESGRSVEWEGLGAATAWWRVADLAELLEPREPTRAELEQFLADVREAVMLTENPSGHILDGRVDIGWANGRDSGDVASASLEIVRDFDRELSTWSGES